MPEEKVRFKYLYYFNPRTENVNYMGLILYNYDFLPTTFPCPGNVTLQSGSKIYHNGKQWVARSATGNGSNLANIYYNGKQWVMIPLSLIHI